MKQEKGVSSRQRRRYGVAVIWPEDDVQLVKNQGPNDVKNVLKSPSARVTMVRDDKRPSHPLRSSWATQDTERSVNYDAGIWENSKPHNRQFERRRKKKAKATDLLNVTLWEIRGVERHERERFESSKPSRKTRLTAAARFFRKIDSWTPDRTTDISKKGSAGQKSDHISPRWWSTNRNDDQRSQSRSIFLRTLWIGGTGKMSDDILGWVAWQLKEIAVDKLWGGLIWIIATELGKTMREGWGVELGLEEVNFVEDYNHLSISWSDHTPGDREMAHKESSASDETIANYI